MLVVERRSGSLTGFSRPERLGTKIANHFVYGKLLYPLLIAAAIHRRDHTIMGKNDGTTDPVLNKLHNSGGGFRCP